MMIDQNQGTPGICHSVMHGSNRSWGCSMGPFKALSDKYGPSPCHWPTSHGNCPGVPSPNYEAQFKRKLL